MIGKTKMSKTVATVQVTKVQSSSVEMILILSNFAILAMTLRMLLLYMRAITMISASARATATMVVMIVVTGFDSAGWLTLGAGTGVTGAWGASGCCAR